VEKQYRAKETSSHGHGAVYWVTGLSGAGKTTIASLFFQKLKMVEPCTVFLDGDQLRNTVAEDLGYKPEERRRAAMRYSRLCKLLADQGINVVCATISMFHECRDWNRENIDIYREIYLKVPVEVLVRRDSKNIYSRALSSETSEVMGVDLEFEEPRSPDIVVENHKSAGPSEIVDDLFNTFYP